MNIVSTVAKCISPPYFVFRSSGVSGSWPNHELDQGLEKRLAPLPHVVHELEEAQVQRQLLLRDPPMRTKPGAQQRPEALQGVDVDLAEPIAVLIAGEL